MSESPFGPVQAGIVGNRAHHENRVIKFPSARERDIRKGLRKSSDPIDVSVHYDPKSRKKEVAHRLAQPQIKQTMTDKLGKFLGLEVDDN